MVSNGSYMASKHIGACSGAFVLKCTRTKQKATCAWAEVQKVSDNYRGELLGTMAYYVRSAGNVFETANG